MTQSRTLEDRLESTGAVLQDRPSVVDRVIAELRQSVRGIVTKPKVAKDTTTKSS